MTEPAPTFRPDEFPTLIGQIVENLPNMVFVKDAGDLRFVLLNRAGEKLLGRSRDELLGRNDYDFFPPDQADFFTSKDREVLASGEVLVIDEEPIETPRGRRWLRTKKVPLLGEDGSPRYLLGISEDITERREAERMKDDLVSIASHELRAPAVAVLGALELVQEIGGDALDGEARRILELGEENGRRMLDVVESWLDLARLDEFRDRLRAEDLDLEYALREAARLNQPYADRFGVQIVVGPVDPAVRVHADPQRLLQLLTNLVSNAAKFSPAGSEVTLSATAHGTAQRICVADRGPGIPRGFREHVFRKFSRARSAATAAREGSGLGLSIAKTLVERMGGGIGFETRTGQGTTFYVDLPTA